MFIIDWVFGVFSAIFGPISRLLFRSMIFKAITIVVIGFIAISCSSDADASPLDVGREIVCKPVNGRQTCLQGAILLDDVGFAALTGAPDFVLTQTAAWLRENDFKRRIGYEQFSYRVAALAYKDWHLQDASTVGLRRRVEVDAATRFVIPFARIDTRPELESRQVKTFKLFAIEFDGRTRYSGDGADICTTTDKRRFCVRITGLEGKRLSQLWNAIPAMPASMFENVVPAFNSTDWKDKSILAVEVEIIDKKASAIDGARVVQARPIQLVMLNLGYVMGTKIGAAK